MVICEQGVPLATPNDLDYVPACTAEEALELLNDLSVATNRPVQALQVGVHNKGQVVQLVVGCKLKRATTLNLVQLTVSEERPDVLL